MRVLGLLALFVFGLVLRLVFQAATPDGGICWHIGFQGDAPVWQDLAARLAHGVDDFEFQVPYRPPGMTYGLAFLWDGEGATVWPVRLLFAALGALTPVLLVLLLRRHVPPMVAWGTGLVCACASNLLLASSGLHVETPYLVLVLLTLFDQQRLVERGGSVVALRWGALHGLLCLLRAEHVLSIAALGFVAWRTRVPWRRLVLAVVGAALPLVPWQLHANALVAAFNAGEPTLPPSQVPWRADALAKLRELPSFQQGPMFRFVGDTVQVRGRSEVRVEDLEVIREAFGVYPEPLRPQFVALQGGMNFWLACVPEGDGGLSGEPWNRPPPLAGGAARYPRWLRDDIPRGGKFSPNYPPHLDVFLHGYARGFAELAADPWGAMVRTAKKVWRGLGGATGGLGGAAMPIGLSGVRRPVDMVLAEGVWAGLWRVGVLGLALAGLWRMRRIDALWPLVAFAASRLFVVAAFFGHARFGVLCLPVVALGAVAMLHTFASRTGRERQLLRLGVAALVLLFALDLVRLRGVDVEVDGRPFTQAPGGDADHRTHTITFR
ncbi:MAG: hypothetical protein JNK15_01140 [Planctomycetes bacterium]|nr:hypothetical protein [Planctomycetota bacterium]